VFTAKIADVANQFVTSAVTVVVQQTPTTVSVTPLTATINPAATQQFAASVVDQFGAAITGRTYAWTVSAGGTIDATGKFTATTSGGPYTVTASTGGKNGLASVTVNALPVAQDVAAATNYMTPIPTTLVATDANNDPLTFSITTAPAHGTLSGTAPALTYLPNSGFFGTDTFRYKAYDGRGYSNIATVSIAVQNKLSLTFSTKALTLMKGSSGSLTISLASQPTLDLTVNMAYVTANTGVIATPTSLSFTTTNWNVPQTVAIQSTTNIQVQPAVSHLSYTGYAFSTVDVAVTITDPATQNNSSLLVKGDAFDSTKFQSDPIYKNAYLAAIIPGRVFQTLAPSSTAPVLKAQGPSIIAMISGSGGVLTVVGTPNAPVTFVAIDEGMFLNNYKNCITVVTDATGLASVAFSPTSAGSRAIVLASSPLASSQVRFVIKSVAP